MRSCTTSTNNGRDALSGGKVHKALDATPDTPDGDRCFFRWSDATITLSKLNPLHNVAPDSLRWRRAESACGRREVHAVKTPLIVGALALLLLGVATTAPAQVAEEIVVAGVVVLRVRTPAGGLSIAERAQAIRQRINQVLTTEDLTAANLFLQPTPGGVTIRVGRVVS